MSLEEMKDAIKDLSHFGFAFFHSNNSIIGDMIEELPTYCAVVDATSELFWSNVEGAEKYDKNLAKKAMRDPDKYTGKTWRDYRIEKAYLVWE